MEIEYISRVSFSPCRTPQEQRNLPVSPGVLGKIIIDYQNITPLLHEYFTHGATCVGGQILQCSGLGGIGCNHDSMLHSAIFLQCPHYLRHLGGLLPDCDIDANKVATLLVYDSIQGDNRLSCRAVADDQLSLSPPDGNDAINRLDAGLHWCVN